jgi:hypothetical protein
MLILLRERTILKRLTLHVFQLWEFYGVLLAKYNMLLVTEIDEDINIWFGECWHVLWWIVTWRVVDYDVSRWEAREIVSGCRLYSCIWLEVQGGRKVCGWGWSHLDCTLLLPFMIKSLVIKYLISLKWMKMLKNELLDYLWKWMTTL